jgi:uncharacterized protein (TIGR00290 family)
MVMREKILLSWSGGKDSSLAYYYIQEAGAYEIAVLLTTITEGYNRVSMHGVRRVLLERQAQSLGLPLQEVYIPKDSVDEEYESRMRDALLGYQRDDINSAGFGDVFLEDVRKYREDRLARIGMKAVFPLWKRDTTKLVRDFIDLGFEAIVTCIDSRVLDSSFAGKLINDDFISRLPPHVDPNGENGEFHSFVLDGPIFKRRVEVSIGERVLRDSFYFCDLLPE